MSWNEYQIYHESEIDREVPDIAEKTQWKMGDNALLWLLPPKAAKYVSLEVKIVGIRFDHFLGVVYDVASQLGETEFYAVIRNVKSHLTPFGHTRPDANDGVFTIPENWEGVPKFNKDLSRRVLQLVQPRKEITNDSSE
jgi:hypothetical protein